MLRRSVWVLVFLAILACVAYPTLRHSEAAGFSYSTTMQPGEGAVLSIKRPLFIWQVDPSGHALEFRMFLDGQEVAAKFDPERKALVFQPSSDLLPGPHNVRCTATFPGSDPVQVVSYFSIDSKSVDPFTNKDKAQLATIEAAGIEMVNDYRRAVGLLPLKQQAALTNAAQAHSNYLTFHKLTGHGEAPGTEGFIGNQSQQRAEYFGYIGLVGEGVSGAGEDASLAVQGLMDAPYHRLSIINPNYTEIGIGFHATSLQTVVNYGTSGKLQDERVIVYPYSGQADVKLGWFVAENPNPLASYGIDKQFVGYPISLSVHDYNTQELRLKSAKLIGPGGADVAVYTVDSSQDPEHKKNIFLIPKQVLTAATTYKVEVVAERVLRNGHVVPVNHSWTFKTVAEPQITSAQLLKIGNGEHIKLYTNMGEIAGFTYYLMYNDQVMRSFRNGYYSWRTNPVLQAGNYKLALTAPGFAKMTYHIEVREVDGKKEVRVGNKE